MRTKPFVGIQCVAATQARRAFPRVRELLLCAGFFAPITVADAAVITLDATQRGFITQSGATNPTNLPPGSRDYLLGNCAFASCPVTGGGEYRDFFAFTIPVLGGAVTSVEFQISTAIVVLDGAIFVAQYDHQFCRTGNRHRVWIDDLWHCRCEYDEEHCAESQRNCRHSGGSGWDLSDRRPDAVGNGV